MEIPPGSSTEPKILMGVFKCLLVVNDIVLASRMHLLFEVDNNMRQKLDHEWDKVKYYHADRLFDEEQFC